MTKMDWRSSSVFLFWIKNAGIRLSLRASGSGSYVDHGLKSVLIRIKRP